jgi:hypothetical protein
MAIGPEIPVDRLVGYVFQQEGINWTGSSMLQRRATVPGFSRIACCAWRQSTTSAPAACPYANAPMGATVDEVD